MALSMHRDQQPDVLWMADWKVRRQPISAKPLHGELQILQPQSVWLQ